MKQLGEGWNWRDLAVGDKFVTYGRTIFEADLLNFVTLCGFSEELFTNKEYIREHAPMRGGHPVPGALVYSMGEGLVIPTTLQGTGLAFLSMGFDIKGPTSIDYMPTDNPQTLDKLRNDPMMLRQPRLDMAYGLVDLMDDARASAARVREPYMMMYGLADRIVPQAPVKAAIEIMPPRADSKLAFYKNGYHLLMRDKAGPAVTADVVVWISDHEAKLPSGADASQSQPEMTSLWGSKRKPPGPR